MNKSEVTRLIRNKVMELGFARCGIAAADYLDEEAPRFKHWLDAGMNGEMDYLSRRTEIRLDPRNLLNGAKSVICLAHSYYTGRQPADPTAPKISKYAQGGDYHRVLKSKVTMLLEYLRDNIGAVKSSISIDTNTILEKAWAARTGVGWVGKNSLIMHRETGSFLFLALVVVDIELDYDQPLPDSCAHCRACIDACPTGAIVEPRVVDARRCISYQTIETKGNLPSEMKGKFDNWVYGCDVCQDVCPWNRNLKPCGEPLFDAKESLHDMTLSDWLKLTPRTFALLFQGTPLARGGYARLKRNLDFVLLP